MTLSANSLVVLALCSHLGLSSEPDPAPLKPKEWSQLGNQLKSVSIQFADLLEYSATQLNSLLQIPENDSLRIWRLLQRTASIGIEIERLASLGISAITQCDPDYPARYLQKLNDSAPPLLFYSGEKALLGQPGIAVVGSRDLDPIGEQCAELVGNYCGVSGLVLYSGGARGVDSISMKAALNGRGNAVGILADSLEKTIRIPVYRKAIQRNDICLVTPHTPDAPFSVGTAMGRNKLIYTLADYAIVVASDAHKGGTWAGATEAIKNQWLPVFVLKYPTMPEGSQLLIKEYGAIPLPYPLPFQPSNMAEWLQTHSGQNPSQNESIQLSLF
jgi:predicted Rossmann fold nucleotide-binding protein DprA/Smf involved in DNA uptake